MALFNKIGAITVPGEGRTINGLIGFKSASGKVVKEKIRHFHKTEMKFIMVETGNNGSAIQETFFCPCDLLGRFKNVRLINKIVTIKPDLMHWISENNSCRIDKDGATLNHIGRQKEQGEKIRRFRTRMASR
jgi:hypothetical protein